MSQAYLLSNSSNELERLRVQAQVWEPEVLNMLNLIGLKTGTRCIDLACGPTGILALLSRAVGSQGQVIGLDMDTTQLTAARAFIQENDLSNVEIMEGDAYATGLPDASFDFVHARFIFAPVGRDDELLREMLRLLRPGGTIAIQEPDASCWNYYPGSPAWDRLKETILAAFRRGGGDLNAGQRMYGMLRRAGLESVRIRAAVIALQNNHPYMALPIQFATSLRQRILDGNLMTEAELDQVVAECQELVAHPNTMATSYIVNQVWGQKP